MKMRSVKYLINQGFKSAWINRLMTLASVGVLIACMVLIGLAILISENVSLMVGNLEKQNVVMVYMKDYNWALYSDKEQNGEQPQEQSDAAEQPDQNGIVSTDYVIHNEDEAKALCKKIEELENVESAEYISSEAGLESVKSNMAEGQEEYFSFLNDEYGNPLSAAAKVKMTDMSQFESTIKSIRKLDGVDVIQSQSDLADKITAIKKEIMIAGVWVIGILMLISLVIVSNTIRVTMYSRKLEISIMKAVGATDVFIRIPFVVEGVLIGVVSALVSEGLLYFCYRVATETFIATFGTNILKYSQVAWWLLLVFLGIGIVAGAIGSFIMIGKYLRREGSEFTAI